MYAGAQATMQSARGLLEHPCEIDIDPRRAERLLCCVDHDSVEVCRSGIEGKKRSRLKVEPAASFDCELQAESIGSCCRPPLTHAQLSILPNVTICHLIRRQRGREQRHLHQYQHHQHHPRRRTSASDQLPRAMVRSSTSGPKAPVQLHLLPRHLRRRPRLARSREKTLSSNGP